MSNPYTGSVASALRKAELLLTLEAPESLGQKALLEAALLQLWRAYRAFLCEVSFQLQLGCEPGSESELRARAAERGITSGEANELMALLEQPDSWLSQLQAAWGWLWSFAAPGGADSRADKLIPLRNLSEAQPSELSAAGLREWQRALGELIRRQRAHSAEW